MSEDLKRSLKHPPPPGSSRIHVKLPLRLESSEAAMAFWAPMAQEMPRGCGVRARRLDSDLELESRRSMDLGVPGAVLNRSFLKNTDG